MIEYLVIRTAAMIPTYILDVFQSVIWHSRFFGIGDFEIYCEATPQNVQKITVDSFVTRSDVEKNPSVGIVRNVRLVNDPQNGVMLIASGYFAKDILRQRLLYKLTEENTLDTIVYSGEVEDAARDAVDKSLINPTKTARKVPNLALGSEKGYTESLPDKRQSLFENLYDWLTAMLSEYSLTCDIFAKESDFFSSLVFEVQKGTDRTESVIISGKLDNLINSTYEKTTNGEKTLALVGGSGTTSARLFREVGTAIGFNRKEVYVNASNVRQTGLKLDELMTLFPGGSVQPSTDDPQYYVVNSVIIASYSNNAWDILDEYYLPFLIAPGDDALQKASATTSYKGEIDVSSGTYKLGKDYFLGDYVTVFDDRLNVTVKAQVTETTEVVDDSGTLVSAVFETKTLPSS